MKKQLLCIAIPLLLLFSVSSRAQKQTLDFAGKYAQTITPIELKEKLSVLAGPAMEGRETATAGQRKAATYIENHFKRLGLLPGTTGSYQMQYPIYQDTLLEASLRVNGQYQKLDSTFSINIFSAANGTYEIKEIVLASYGIVDSSRNDYQDLDVKGKWVLIFEGSPSSPTRVADRRSPYSNNSKVELAAKQGAKGVFIMSGEFPKRSFEKKGNMYTKKPASTMYPR